MRTRQHLVGMLILVLLLVPVGANARSGTPSTGAYVDPTVLTDVSDGGQTTAWVLLRPKANLKRASKIEDWDERGRFVYDTLTKKAENTQNGLRKLLEKRGVAYQPFWIVNAIQVTADEAVIGELARQPEVERILPPQVYHVPEPTPGVNQATIQSVEWGIDRINAPDVWSTFGVRGEGIVVASIDTGVQFDHPALVEHYRGNLGGSFNHNYNWFDPTKVCGDPSLVPCDNNDHGTHVTGTMVGDDGGTNQIGVAPGAKWIAAKGCVSRACTTSDVLAAGQWLLAPTELDGENPRPDLRPHIINNSWGGGGGDPFYQGIVDAWIASGIFPMFANGNSGPSCSSAGSPGDYVATYSAGAFGIDNAIAGFSSRGASAFGGEVKPNIAAPGVDIRSSVPGNGYDEFNGTSMASPHVAGAIALLWSAKPSLIGNVNATRNILDQTAIDTEDLQCGGTAADNNVFGEGRLDVFAAVTAAMSINEPPQVDADGPYSGSEGSPISLAGSASDIDGDALTSTWAHTSGAPCVFDDPATLETTFTCTDDGAFTVALTVSDGMHDPVTDTATVTVSNVAPTATLANDGPVDEGSPVTVSFSDAVDPSSVDTAAGFHYAFACDNGDLSESTYANSGAASSQVCNVTDDGNFSVRARIIDKDGGFNEYTTTVEAVNVDPLVDAGDDVTIDEGALLSRSGSFTDPGADTWTATVDYGDGGGVEVLVLDGNGFTLSHVYSDGANDPYTVTVCVTDDVGGEGCDSFEVEVLSASEQVALLAATIDGMHLPHNLTKPLFNKLAVIDRSISRGATIAACNQLGALTNFVEAKRGKGLTDAQADQLIADVDRIHATLGCG